MTEQFDARKPPVSRIIRDNGRTPTKLSYRECVTIPTAKDTIAIMIICFGIIVWWGLFSSWLVYNIVDYSVLAEPTVRNLIIICMAMCGAVGFLVRSGIHEDKYYANTKPMPRKETIEFSVKAPEVTIADRKTAVVNGERQQLDYDPVPLEHKGQQFTITREHIKQFRQWVDADDFGMSRGRTSKMKPPIIKKPYSRFISILKGRGYIVQDGREWLVTDLWVSEVLQYDFPPTPNDDDA